MAPDRRAPAAYWWAHHRGVHAVQIPAHGAAGVRLRLQALQHPVGHAGLAPAVEPARHGSGRPVAGRQVLPGRTGTHDPTQDPQHAVEHLAVIFGRPARARCEPVAETP